MLAFWAAAPLAAQTLNEGGVVDAASFKPVLSRGGIGSLFGVDLASSTAAAPSIPLPTTLGTAQVLIDGTPAPLYFVSAGQINFQVPFEAPLSGTVSVTVVRGGVTSNAVSVAVAPYAPGIFANPATGEPIVVKQDNSLVTAANPAQPGDVLVIYVTGIGDLLNPPSTGAASLSDPLAAATVAPTVTVGGVATTVYFAGLTPGLVGLGQINIGLPETFPAALREAAGPAEGIAQLVVDFGNGMASAPAVLPIVDGPLVSDAFIEMREILPP
ncbi:MAG: hypothetical protein KDC27_09550, partial [Acidobacteria bacterium]|nr:hypothetical protein [Acidobacteriota bacterium]